MFPLTGIEITNTDSIFQLQFINDFVVVAQLDEGMNLNIMQTLSCDLRWQHSVIRQYSSDYLLCD